MKNLEILKKFYNQYTKEHLKKIFLAVLFSVAVAGSTSSIAWLLDPAIEKLFINKEISDENDEKFGKLSLITRAFQTCYLNSNLTDSYFINLINSPKGEYSRYLFFYLANLIEKKNYNEAKQLV